MSKPKDQEPAVIWRRQDLPGHESCRIVRTDAGWELVGTAVLAYEGRACRLDYEIVCDKNWLTRSAGVSGWYGTQDIDITIIREESGLWHLNGRACPELGDCVDVDLNFSPSTNLLPIRRLSLAIGHAAAVRAAWLRFPSFALEALNQSYTRIAEDRYRYESNGGQFVAEVTVDSQDLPIDYGKIWSRE